MLLVADGGSTKTNWALLSPDPCFFETEGYHPFFVGRDYISRSLSENLPQTVLDQASDVSQIFFYSAGGGYSAESDQILVDGISQIFKSATINIETDLIAAARSLLGDAKGFAAILGTGTNTCIYDGTNVTENIESLGFLLGDEGSGSYIGKKIIGDYVRGLLPEKVRKDFQNACKSSPVELLNKVYENPLPNRFCASFARFVGENLHNDPYYFSLAYTSFHDFFRNIVTKYAGYENYDFNCTGSVAWHFRDVLRQVAHEHRMKMGVVEKDPMRGLVEYHLKSVQRNE